MVHYKLVYFNLRGRAELARLIFAAAGQEYEDHRIEQSDWPHFKPTTPFGQLPYLEFNDDTQVYQIPQSISIARFLARKFNLAGQNEREQAEVDMYADQITDLANDIIEHHREKEEAKKAQLHAKILNETVPHTFKIFEDKFTKSNSGYLVPSGLTWTDLYLFTVTEWLLDKKQESLASFPLLKAHDNRIRTLPRIAEWLRARPQTIM